VAGIKKVWSDGLFVRITEFETTLQESITLHFSFFAVRNWQEKFCRVVNKEERLIVRFWVFSQRRFVNRKETNIYTSSCFLS